jgi:hypothetical protein
MKMKSSQKYMSILAALGASSAVAADETPQRFNFDRYTAMLNRSPFAVATAVVAPAQAPNFAKDLYVANAAHTADADLVTIISGSDKGLKEYLSTKGPNEHGYSISNIQWSDQPGETKVTISKDGQFATLPFNQALLAAPPPTNQPPAGPGAPPTAPMPNPAQNAIPKPPPSVPAAATPNPRVRGVIQRNPASAPQPPPVATPYVPPAAEQ